MLGGDEVGAVVVDIGSFQTRAGFAGEDVPKAVFSTAVGTTLIPEGQPSVLTEAKDGRAAAQRKRYFVGQGVTVHRDDMEIEAPVKQGLIEDFDAAERLIEFGLHQYLRLDLKENPLLLVEANHNTAEKRQRLAEIAFERLGVPALFVCKSAVLAAFASAKSTGLVLDSGGDHTTAVSVLEGFVLNRTVVRSRVAGNTLDQLLDARVTAELEKKAAGAGADPGLGPGVWPRYSFDRKPGKGSDFVVTKRDLSRSTASFHNFMKMEVIRDIKESLCRVSETESESEDSSASDFALTYELPDGRILELGQDRFSVPEAMFAPKGRLAEDEYTVEWQGPHNRAQQAAFTGLPAMVKRSIELADVDIRKDLWSTIILSGGNTLYSGFPGRVGKELNAMAPSSFKPKILAGSGSADQERRWAPWVGGSILGSLGTFHQMWFSKQEYEEHGVHALQRKCP